jgi:metallo-beta-lactamase class B
MYDLQDRCELRRQSVVPMATIALAGCLLASVAHAQREWNTPTEPFHVIDNIHYVGTKGLAAYLITTPEGHFLLDGATKEAAPLIERSITTLGFKLTDVKYLLNSHAHFDHSGGLAELKRKSGAQLIASQGDRSALEGGFYLGFESRHDLDAPPVKVDRTIADGGTLTLGKVTLTAKLTPGHTRGCTSWSMPVTDQGKRLDVLFFCSSSVALNRLVNPPQYSGIVEDYEKTFAKAKAFKVDVFLAPHPEFFGLEGKRGRLANGGANPFIGPGEFAAFLAQSESDFRKQLASQQAAGAK